MTTKTMEGVTDIDVTHSEYIKKSDVLAICFEWDMNDPCVEQMRKQFNLLPTIDPAQVIDEMIEETEEKWEDMNMETMERIKIQDTLQELKQRLSHKK